MSNEAETGWQPIETAPARAGIVVVWNGREVLAACNTVCAGWIEAAELGVDRGWLPIVPEPTHWQPLPPPPEEVK